MGATSSAVKITVQDEPKPDLQIGLIGSRWWSYPGQRFTTDVTFKNTGNKNSVATTAKYYWKQGSTRSLFHTTSVPALASNEESVSQSYEVLAPSTAGDHELQICVDSGSNIESDTTNNCLESELEVRLEKATIASEHIKSTGLIDATFSTMINPQGSATRLYFDYGETTNYGKTLDAGDVGNGSEYIWMQRVIFGLECNKTYHIRARTEGPAGTTLGDDVQFSTLDCDTPLPDLTLTSVSTTKRTVSKGETFSIEAIANNQGTDYSGPGDISYFLLQAGNTLVLGRPPILPSLAPKRSYAGKQYFDAPYVPGEYIVWACVSGSVKEADAENNCSGGQTLTVEDRFAESFSLSVTKEGRGSVASVPGVISCGSTCSDYYNEGTLVSLAASSASGWRFERWSGSCTGSGRCEVEMDGNKAVVAYFKKHVADDHPDASVIVPVLTLLLLDDEPPTVDLSVSSLQIVEIAVDHVTWAATVKNVGNQNIPIYYLENNIVLQAHVLNSNSERTAGGKVLSTTLSDQLASGESREVRLRATVDTTGMTHLRVKVDSNNVMSESNEENNSLTLPLR